ncbi:MAG: hypothetical protein K9K67_05095 [Bacteriovoracaceae bacterium]|nr:hypothetical protein [Bacteriovoracaceae bacterium]
MKFLVLSLLLSFIAGMTNLWAQDYDIYGNYIGNTFTIEFRPQINYGDQRQGEQNRVNNYYVPDVNISGQIVSSIQGSSNSLQTRINQSNADYINFGDNFSQFMTQVGAGLNGSLQGEFVNNVLASTGKVGANQIVPVVPYLDDMPAVDLGNLPESHGKLNRARLQASKFFDDLYKRCENQNCNSAGALGLQRGVNNLLEQAIENGKNAAVLSSWGEDTSAYEASLDNINELLENPTPEDVLAEALKQERLKEQLQDFYEEWGVPWNEVESNSNLSDVEQLADNVFELKKCIALGNCDLAPMEISGEHQNVKKQFNGLLKTQKRVVDFDGNPLYKNAASDFLGQSSNSLAFGDLVNSKKLEDVSNALIDIGLGLTPGVSVAKDVYELITGKSLVTGEELSIVDRTLAGIGILTLGGSNYLKAGVKTLGKLGPLAKAGLGKALDMGAGAIRASKRVIADLGADKFTKIMRLPKNQRPDPTTYLKESYITEHLSKFNEGASRFMRKSIFDRYGPAQIDGTAFMVTKSEAESILAKTGGDPRALEEILALKPGALENDRLIRIDVKNPRDFNVRIPSGREAGANPLWIPGGKLPDGSLEAVIDLGDAPAGSFDITEL